MDSNKFIKLILLLGMIFLILVGVGLTIYGFAAGWNDTAVNAILMCAYAFAGLALLAVIVGVVIFGGISNPMSLVKLAIGLVICAVVVAGAYFLAPGTAPVGYLGEPVSELTLKLTDTIMNLTYLLCGGALLALVAGGVMSVLKK